MVPSTERSGRAPCGSVAFKLHVDRHGAVLDGGVDAADLALDDAVVRVDFGRLADLDVARLGFGNLERGLELVGLHDLGERDADGDVLAHLVRQVYQHAGDARANAERGLLLSA